MKLFRYLLPFTLLLFNGCTAIAQAPMLAPHDDDKEMQQLPLSQLSVQFLYLSAIKALDDNNPGLAIEFLKAVAEKDPDAVLPRKQLAALLLQSGRASEARQPVQELLAMPDLSAKERGSVRMLQVQMLILDDKVEQAAQALRSMLHDDPDNYTARLMLIRVLTSSDHYAEALRVVADGLKGGRNPQLYHIQAQLYIHEGAFDKAEASLKAMMKLEPGEPGPVLMYSQLAIRQNKPDKAEKVLRGYLKTHPENLTVSNALGRLLVEQKRGKEAIAIYKHIAERTGDNPDVLTALGLLYYQQKDYTSATATFRRVLAARKDSRTLFYLAASLEALGKNDAARKIYQRIKSSDGSYPEAQLRMAAMDVRQQHNDAALVTLRQLIKLEPRMDDAYTLLSAVLMRQKQYQQMLDETEAALSLPKVSVQLLFNRAAAFEALKRYNQAAGQIKKLFTIDPDNVEALNFLGYLYAEQGVHLKEAEKLIRRALQKNPNNGYYLDSLAWVHYQQAEYAKALAVQRKAVAQIPNDPIMREHLGDIQWRNGLHDEARATWKLAIKLGHKNTRSMQNKIEHGL